MPRFHQHTPFPLSARARWTLAICAAALWIGCGGTSSPERRGLELPDSAPAWAGRGCAGHDDAADASMICALGSAVSTRNPALARTTAISRARTELARSIQVEIDSLLADYGTSTGEGARSSDDQRVIDVSRQITKVALEGSRVLGTWTSDEGEVFALVALQTDALGETTRRHAPPPSLSNPPGDPQ